MKKIPKNTDYCYTIKKRMPAVDSNLPYIEIETCPYWGRYWNPENWNWIYVCHYLDIFDEKEDTSLIWDKCKSCNIGLPE